MDKFIFLWMNIGLVWVNLIYILLFIDEISLDSAMRVAFVGRYIGKWFVKSVFHMERIIEILTLLKIKIIIFKYII